MKLVNFLIASALSFISINSSAWWWWPDFSTAETKAEEVASVVTDELHHVATETKAATVEPASSKPANQPSPSKITNVADATEASKELPVITGNISDTFNLFDAMREDLLTRAPSVKGENVVGGFVDIDSSYSLDKANALLQRLSIGSDFSINENFALGVMYLRALDVEYNGFSLYGTYKLDDLSVNVMVLGATNNSYEDGKALSAKALSVRGNYVFTVDVATVLPFVSVDVVKLVGSKDLAVKFAAGAIAKFYQIENETMVVEPSLYANISTDKAEVESVTLKAGSKLAVTFNDYFSLYGGIGAAYKAKEIFSEVKVGLRLDV